MEAFPHFISLLLLAALTLTLTLSQHSQHSQHSLQAHPETPEIPSSNFTTFRSSHSPSHSIRISSQNSTLCDARSKQYTGWLDVGTHHLFFWYFESLGDPERDPLTMWLNGGPGGSSMLGLLQELGPCLITPTANTTSHNKYSWTKATNLIFIDQPAGVGFSYISPSPDGSPAPVPGSSFSTATDVHIFLQIFITQVFPHLQDRPFHISGESYAGHYIPALASHILHQNTLHPSHPRIPLKSILIGNAYISPADTTWGHWQTLCTAGPSNSHNPQLKSPVFNSTRCDAIASALPRCLSLSKVCYMHPDYALCAAAEAVCLDGVVNWYDSESGAGGRNRYDITAPCEIERFCYPSTDWIETYLNLNWVQEALHITPEMPAYDGNFTAASGAVEAAFYAGVDFGISMEPHILHILENQVHILLYQGNLDLACNTAGNLRWADSMDWVGQAEFASKLLVPWGMGVSGKQAGRMKEVRIKMGGGEKTRFAFVTVDGSGHMVPQDQPRVALDLVQRWLRGEEFD